MRRATTAGMRKNFIKSVEHAKMARVNVVDEELIVATVS